MSELICPHCGNSNPPDKEFCASCGKPLFGDLESGLDWMRGMRDASAQPPDESATPPAERKGDTGSFKSEEVIPEWLDRIRQRASQELGHPDEPDETEPASHMEDEEQLPDWLKDIKGIQSSPQEEEQEEQPSETGWLGNISSLAEEAADEEEPIDLPDWLELSGSRSESSEGQPKSEDAEPPTWEQTGPPEEASGEEDWLSRLDRQPPEEQPGSHDESQRSELEPLDWTALAGNSEEDLTPPPIDSVEPQGEVPAFGESDQLFESAESGGLQEEETPDWLSSLITSGEEQPEEELIEPSDQAGEATPDWLSGLEMENPEQPGEAKPSGESDEGTPAWLSSLNAFSQDEEEGELAQEPIEEVEAAPSDWLSGLESESPEHSEDQATAGEGAEVETSAWLSSHDALDEEQPEEEPVSEETEQLEESPSAWLSSLPVEGEEQPEPVKGGVPGEPEWLSAVGQEELPEGENQPEEASTPEWLTSLGGDLEGLQLEKSEEAATEPAESVPDWLSAAGAQEPLPGEAPAEELPLEGVPDWLSQFQVEPEAESREEDDSVLPDLGPDFDFKEGEEILSPPEGSPGAGALEASEQMPPFASDDLPDWFAEEGTFEEAQPSGEPVEEGGPYEVPLEPAELPGWLQAMRPLEEVAPGRASVDVDQHIENSGPLAGYQGVLPGDALVTRYAKPPTYSIKLQVTEKQRIYATLLEDLVTSEKGSKAKIAEKSSAPQVIARLLVGFAIVAFVGFILFSGVHITSLPNLYAQETVSFYSHIQSITDVTREPAQVLVALDYEAALSGEIKTISTGVLRDLLSSNTRLALVSVVASGPALADDLVTSANISRPPAEQVINLGFLPGGATGIAALSLQPAQVLPVALDGTYAWTHPALEGISRLSDFDAVLLLTDNAENSRAWVEQAGPYLGETPLLVISSAQSAPMLQPFVHSGQVNGLLSGMIGSASYAQLAQRPGGTIRAYWDAYQAGLLLIVVLILAGSLYYGSRRLLASQKPLKKV